MRTWLVRSACVMALVQACGEEDDNGTPVSVASDAAVRRNTDNDDAGVTANADKDAEVPNDAALGDAALGDASPTQGTDDGGPPAPRPAPPPRDAGDAGDGSSMDGGDAASRSGVTVPVSTPVVSSTVEVVAFDRSRAQHPIPVLLFQGGYASYNVDQLVKPIDIAYDVVEHPESWPVWRRTATGLEIEGSNGFVPFDYSYTCSALPRGTTLSGMFEYTSSTTIGTDAGVFEVERYRFAADGTYESCNMTQTVIVASGTISSKRTQKKGRYVIDGYTIRLTNDDGTSAFMPFFYDPNRSTRLWIEKTNYVTPTKTPATLCVAP